LAIARRFPCDIVTRRFDTYINQKNFALDYCRHEWVLSVDADEVITPELAEEVERLAFDVAGYVVRRRTFLGEREIHRGAWAHDDHVRLFRRSCGRWGGSNPHERVFLDGVARRLRWPMLHYSYRDRQEFLSRNRKYTEMLVEHLLKQGRTTYRGEGAVHAAGNFLKSFILRLGFLDGETGWFLSYNYARLSYLKYAMLAERRRASQTR
jgi:hypothetical protein